MENKFATISTIGECEDWKLPISRQVYDAYVMAMKETAQDDDGETAPYCRTRFGTIVLKYKYCPKCGKMVGRK